MEIETETIFNFDSDTSQYATLPIYYISSYESTICNDQSSLILSCDICRYRTSDVTILTDSSANTSLHYIKLYCTNLLRTSLNE